MITEKELRYAKKIIKNNKCDGHCISCPIEDDCRFSDTVIEAAERIIEQSKIDSGEIYLISENNIEEYISIMKEYGKDKAIEFAKEKMNNEKECQYGNNK